MNVTEMYSARKENPTTGKDESAMVFKFDFGNTMEVFRDGSKVFRSEKGRKINPKSAYLRCSGMEMLAEQAMKKK